MKIGFLITYFYPKLGGAENNCYNLARELAKKHEVHVFCSGSQDSEETIEGIQVHRSKELLRVKYYLAYYPSIVNKLASYKLDILHVHGLGFPQHDKAITHLLNMHPQTKIVCTPHGPFMALNSYNPLASSFKSVYMTRIRKLLKKYSLFFQVNPYQKTWMHDDYGIPYSKIKFLPNGISQDLFSKPNAGLMKFLKSKYSLNDKFVLSYVGRIQKYKGLDQVIKSLAGLPENVVFVAIGEDVGDKPRLQSLAKNLAVQDRVIFTGRLSDAYKIALLDISKVFVFPSEWEAFGISALEAMARKNVIVSTKTEGGKYLVQEGKNGYLFDYGSETQLQNILKRLISQNLTSMSKNNHALAKKFLWSDITKQLEKYYREIL